MPADNLERVHAVFGAIDRGDLEGFLELLHPEVEFTSLIAEAEGGVYRGHEGARAWWHSVAQGLGGLRFERRHVEAIGSGGLTHLRIVANVEGVEVPQTMWQAWLMRDGLVSWWGIFRTEAAAREALSSAG